MLGMNRTSVTPTMLTGARPSARVVNVQCCAGKRVDCMMSNTKRSMLAGLAVLCLTATTCEAAHAASCPNYEIANNGLQYCDEVVGTGQSPSEGSMIRAHYTGRLASNGAVFDSSYDRGKPLSFKVGVGQVIKGWDAGILGTDNIPPMKEGGKRKLVIPADLAYGERGAGRGLIPPGATLQFDVELLPPRTR